MLDHVLHAFYDQPHAITPEKLWEIETVLMRRAAGGRLSAEDLKRYRDPDDAEPAPAAGPRDRAGVVMAGKVALLPISGVIAQRMNLFMAISGGTSTEVVGRALDDLVADRGVRSILMVIDSPGGSVFGVAELGQKILKAREEKKIVAIADSMAASAAYWLGSQAEELNVTPGGMVGSIGVIAAHRDMSKAEEKEGIKTTLITAGKFKGEGDPSQPLTVDAQEYLQQIVDSYYEMFVASVAKGRGVTENKVKTGMGEGRVVLAKKAVDLGMADRVSTLDQVLGRLGAGDGGQEAGVRGHAPLAAKLAALRARSIRT